MEFTAMALLSRNLRHIAGKEMEMLKEFELGEEAKEYIREEMAQGLTLSSLFLRLPLLEGGRVITQLGLPAGTLLEWVQRFPEGMNSAGGLQKQWAEDVILEYLTVSDRRYAILEWTLGHTIVDPLLQNIEEQWFSYGTEPYFFVNSQAESPDDEVEWMVRFSHNYPGIIVLTSIPENEPYFTDRQTVTEAMLQMLAERVEHLLISAYDGEGFLLWSREPK